MASTQPDQKTSHFNTSMINQEFDLLSFYDGLSQIAHALTLKATGSFSEEEYALIRQALQEILFLSKKGKFLDGQKDPFSAVDAYLVQKLPKLAEKLLSSRSHRQRFLISIYLMMREYCLQVIDHLLKIIQALCLIKTPESLLGWKQVFVEACLRDIQALKETYLLIDRFPLELSFPLLTNEQNKQITTLLGFHPPSRDTPAGNYINGNIQAFFLHHLVHVIHTLNRLSAELPIVAIPEVVSNHVLVDIRETKNANTEGMTDDLIRVLESLTFESTIAPTMSLIASGSAALKASLELLAELPHLRRSNASDETKKTVRREAKWCQYRQHWLENRYHLLAD